MITLEKEARIINDFFMGRDELYKSMPDCLSKDALWKLIKEYDFETILDLGAGEGLQSRVLYENGKKVTAISAYDSDAFPEDLKDKVRLVVADYLKWESDTKFDCIFASHILEHQLNIGFFLRKVYNDLNDNGIFVVSVPPPVEPFAGGGHINLFTPGHLIYHLIMNGFDLSDMRLKVYGYNISIICRKNMNFNLNDDNYSLYLRDMYDVLPDYVVEKVKQYIEEHPDKKLPGGGHERIPDDIEYKW